MKVPGLVYWFRTCTNAARGRRETVTCGDITLAVTRRSLIGEVLDGEILAISSPDTPRMIDLGPCTYREHQVLATLLRDYLRPREDYET